MGKHKGNSSQKPAGQKRKGFKPKKKDKKNKNWGDDKTPTYQKNK